MRAVIAALMLCALIARAYAESGIASVYGGRDGYCGKPVAAGGVLDCRALTAAHRNCILVRINDRGPYVRGRIIDLTPTGARALGFSGLARVTVEAIR